MMDAAALLLGASVDAGTAVALASLGLLANERAGIVNLGAEGMMLVGALAGFATVAQTRADLAGFAAGAAAGAALAVVFGVLVIWLNTNQYATGLAASLFGAGVSAFIGVPYTQESLGERAASAIPGLSELPWIGPALFRHHPLVYSAPLLAVGLHVFLFRARSGLVLRGVGESPETAHALGYPVRRIRLACVAAGGALCGLAGAYTSVVYTPLWVEGMIAGKGWIALALTTFATWRPLRALAGAYLFGGVTMLQLHLQGQGVNVPSQLLAMLPYVATVLVLVLITRNPALVRANMPASIGKPFHPGA
ncbi:MAG TPA: ABC transporter permease [Polyangiaceae bacterium]|nr:ABC transporter permease [Polyangiaceae bacterium]